MHLSISPHGLIEPFTPPVPLLFCLVAAAFAVVASFIVLGYFHVPHDINVVVTLLSIFSARLLAIFFHIEMPKFDYASSLRRGRDK